MRRFSSLVLAAILAVGLTACSAVAASERPDASTGSADSPSPVVEENCPQALLRLSELPLADDVRTATGVATACLPSHIITPVADRTAPELPVTVTDAEGREVEITDASRILPVDISGTIAATVFALGLGENVVGRDSSTLFAGTEDLPVVTKSGHTLNPEAILQLAPTVLLTDTTIGPKEVRQQLRDAGIAVVTLSDDRRLDNTADHISEVATALGVPSRGAELIAQVEQALLEAQAEIAEVVPAADEDRARMLFLYVRGNANIYYIFGQDSGADSLIEALGGIDVAGEIGWEGMKPMNAEALVAAQPDVLVMMTDGLASVGGIEGLIERVPAVAETPAGVNRRVIEMADTDILSFGPRSPEILRALARALYAPAAAAESVG